MNGIRSERGFTFIEVMTAIMLTASIVVVIFPIVSQLTNEQHRHSTIFQAGLIGQSVIERLKSGDQLLENRQYIEQHNDSTYTVEIKLLPYDTDIIKVEVVIEWETIHAKMESLRLFRLFPDI